MGVSGMRSAERGMRNWALDDNGLLVLPTQHFSSRPSAWNLRSQHLHQFLNHPIWTRHFQVIRRRAMLPQSIRKAVFGPLGALYPRLYGAPRFLRANR